jgi:hypothetical protein
MLKHSLLFAASLWLLSYTATAQAGTLITNVNLPVPGNGVSVAVDCGNPTTVYYTHTNARLYKMTSAGADLGNVQILDTVSGRSVAIDEIAFDFTRGGPGGTLWGAEHGTNPVAIWRINPATGAATLAFVSQTISIGTFRDGLAFDAGADINNPADDSIFVSGDVSTTIEEYRTDGTFLRSLTPTNAAGGTLGSISGVMVGRGDQLYLGRNGAVQIVRVRKSDGGFIGSFASPGGARDEGLECDPISFAPRLALWSREFNSPGFMSVIEVEPDSCTCGGAQNTPPSFTRPTCGSTIGGFTGGLVTFTVTVTDPDAGASLTLSQTGAPAGSTFTPPLPATGPSPLSSTFNWTPTVPGIHTIVFSVTDGTNTVTCSVDIVVIELCMLLLGHNPTYTPLPWSPTDVLLVDPLVGYFVTMTNIPVVPIPNDPGLNGLPIYGQVYMDNAATFPGDPYQLSDGLEAVLGVGSRNYGPESGMSIWLNAPPALGGTLSFAFNFR